MSFSSYLKSLNGYSAASFSRKCKISGTIDSAVPSQKRIVLLHKETFAIMGSTLANNDGTWTVWSNTTETNKILALCIDDSGQFNADVYISLDLCNVSFSQGADWYSWNLLNRPKLNKINEICTYEGSFPWDSTISAEDFKRTIAKFVFDSIGTSGRFLDSSDNAVSVGSGNTVPEVGVGTLTDDLLFLKGISGDGTSSNGISVNPVYKGHKFTADIFSDSSILMHLPLLGNFSCNGPQFSVIPSFVTFGLGRNSNENAALFYDKERVINLSRTKIETSLKIGNVDFSVSFFIYRYASSQTIIAQTGGFVLYESNGNLYVTVNTNAGAGYNLTLNLNHTLNYAVWEHWVLTVGATGVTFTVNNVQKYTTNANYRMNPTPGDGNKQGTLCLGNDNSGSGYSNYYPFRGLMYNVRVFNKVLSAGEITTLYNESPVAGGIVPVSKLTNVDISMDGIKRLIKNSTFYSTVLISSKQSVFKEKRGENITSFKVLTHREAKHQNVVLMGSYAERGTIKAPLFSNTSDSSIPLGFYGSPFNAFNGVHTGNDCLVVNFGAASSLGQYVLPETSYYFTFYFSRERIIKGFTFKGAFHATTYQNLMKSVRVEVSLTGRFDGSQIDMGTFNLSTQTLLGQWLDWTEIRFSRPIKAIRFYPKTIQTFLAQANSYLAIADSAFITTEPVSVASKQARSFVFDIASNHGGSNMGVRSILFTLARKPICTKDWSFYSTSNTTNLGANKAFTSTPSKGGPASQFCWMSAAGQNTNQRIIAVAPESVFFDDIEIVNYHDNGGSTTYGIQSVKITTSSDAITDTTYDAAVANSEVLYEGNLQQYLNLSLDPDCGLVIENYKKPMQARSVVFDVTDSWGNATYLGVRSIEFYNKGQRVLYNGSWNCFATTKSNTNMYPVFDHATDVASPSVFSTTWNTTTKTNQRIGVTFDEIKEFDTIKIVNCHSGNNYCDAGIRNVEIKMTCDPTAPSSSFNAALSNGITLGQFVIPPHKINIGDKDRWSYTPSYSPRIPDKARSVVFDFNSNHFGCHLTLYKLEFYCKNSRVAAYNWNIYASDSATGYTPTPLITDSGETDYATSSNSWKSVNPVSRLVVVFPSVLEFDEIRVRSLEGNTVTDTLIKNSVRNVSVYKTLDVLGSSDAVFQQTVPNGTLVTNTDISIGQEFVSSYTNVSNTVIYKKDKQGINYWNILLLHSDKGNGSTTFEDSSLYSQDLAGQGTISYSTAQNMCGISSINTSIGFLRSRQLSKYAFSDNNFLIGLYIYPVSVTGFTGLVSKWLSSGNQKSFCFGVNNGNLSFRYTTDGSTEVELLSSGTISTNTWTYVEVIRKRRNLYFRINGNIEAAQDIALNKLAPSYGYFVIGTYNETTANCFQGYIDELSVELKGPKTLGSITPPTTYQSLNLAVPSDPCNLFMCFSFDNKNTYSVFTSNAWRSIASCDPNVHGNVGDTDWYFRDNASVWSKTGILQNAQAAISKAIYQGSNNKTTKSVYEALSQAQWAYSGGFTSTGYFDSALTFQRDGSDNETFIDMIIDGKKYWFSEIYNLSDYAATVTSSKVSWSLGYTPNIKDFYHTNFLSNFSVHVIKTGDSAWTQCTNGSSIPILTQGMETEGISIQFRIGCSKLDIPTKFLFPELTIGVS